MSCIHVIPCGLPLAKPSQSFPEPGDMHSDDSFSPLMPIICLGGSGTKPRLTRAASGAQVADGKGLPALAEPYKTWSGHALTYIVHYGRADSDWIMY